MFDDVITIVSDPLLSEFGPTRPVILMADEFRKRNFHVRVISAKVVRNIRRLFKSKDVSVLSIDGETPERNESLAWFKQWFAEALFSKNSRKISKLTDATLNFSNTIACPSKCWYAQGPPTVTLRNIKKGLDLHYRLVYSLISKYLEILDIKSIKKFAGMSKITVTNSNYLKGIYSSFGVNVSHVVYPPLDCQFFCPKKSKISFNYVLTYFGKETKLDVIKRLAEHEIDILVFGGKTSAAPKWMLKHPKIKFLGRISNEKLVYLYSNALFTIYPFLDEPFGYIPIESMSCGTPVLTFDKQGPSETVIDGVTGWLVKNDKDMIKLAVRIWKEGYSSYMRKECRSRALAFDKKEIAEKWIKLLSGIENLVVK